VEMEQVLAVKVPARAGDWVPVVAARPPAGENAEARAGAPARAGAKVEDKVVDHPSGWAWCKE